MVFLFAPGYAGLVCGKPGYRCGDLVDLCRGPHLPNTNRAKARERGLRRRPRWKRQGDGWLKGNSVMLGLLVKFVLI